jgi:phosphoglycerate dehydrogenase-like enzyme
MNLRIVGPIQPGQIRQIAQAFPGMSLHLEASGSNPQEVDILLAWEAAPDHVASAIRMHPSLRWVHTNAAGIHPTLIEALAERATILTNGTGAQASAIAEYVVAALLTFAKRLRELDRLQGQAQWSFGFKVTELRGMTVGIVGLGNAGRAIARLLRPFGVRLLGVRRHPGAVPEIDGLYARSNLSEFLAQLNALVIAAPLTDETRGMIGRAELAQLPDGAYLINVARGPIVDEDALIAALRSGHLAGAALDVFAEEPLPTTSPFWALPNAIVSPHCCDHTPQTDERGLELFLDNLSRYLCQEPLRNVVDRSLGY